MILEMKLAVFNEFKNLFYKKIIIQKLNFYGSYNSMTKSIVTYSFQTHIWAVHIYEGIRAVHIYDGMVWSTYLASRVPVPNDLCEL